MRTIDIVIRKTVGYDYIIFNGENADAIIAFAGHYGLIAGDKEDCCATRPEDLPDLESEELLEWWISVGEIVDGPQGTSYNTHGRHNMPLWRKGELLKIDMRCNDKNLKHLCNREFFKKGMALVYIEGCYTILEPFTSDGWTEEGIHKEIEKLIKFRYS